MIKFMFNNIKSVLFGLIALVMAFGLVFSVSAFKQSPDVKQTGTYWYEITYDGATPKISSAYLYDADKEDVLLLQSCEDENPSFMCLYGSTDDDLPIDQAVSVPAEHLRIYRSN